MGNVNGELGMENGERRMENVVLGMENEICFCKTTDQLCGKERFSYRGNKKKRLAK